MYYPRKDAHLTREEILRMFNAIIHMNGLAQSGYDALPPDIKDKFVKRQQPPKPEDMVLFAKDVPPLAY